MLRVHATEPDPVAGLSVGARLSVLWVMLTCAVMPKLPS
jgi:hypothetical protein